MNTQDLRPYPEYRDSGVPWLGTVPKHWNVRRCKYLFREVDRRSEKGEETHLSMSQARGLIPSSDLGGRRLHSESYAGGKLCETNDLVLNRLKAHLGVFAVAKQPGVISPDYTVLRPVGDCIPDLYMHVFKTPACTAELRCSTKGIVEGFWRLYTDDFYNIRVPVPSLEESQAILRFIRMMDAKNRHFIRNRRRLIEVLNEQKQVIIDRAITRGLDPAERLKPSGIDWLGDVPQHWEVRPSKSLFRHRNERAVSGEQHLTASQSHGVISRDEFMQIEGRRVMQTLKLYDILRHVEPGDFVMSMRSFEGGLELSKASGAISSAYVMLVPTADIYAPFFRFLFKSTRYIAALRRTSDLVRDGQALRYANFAEIPLPLMPLTEQKRIAEMLEKEISKIAHAQTHAQRAIALVQEYRTRIIADVVTGKLDVRHLTPPPIELDDIEDIDAEEALDDDLDGVEEGDIAEEALNADD